MYSTYFQNQLGFGLWATVFSDDQAQCQDTQEKEREIRNHCFHVSKQQTDGLLTSLFSWPCVVTWANSRESGFIYMCCPIFNFLRGNIIFFHNLVMDCKTTLVHDCISLLICKGNQVIPIPIPQFLGIGIRIIERELMWFWNQWFQGIGITWFPNFFVNIWIILAPEHISLTLSHEKTCVFAGVFNGSMENDSQIWGTSDSLESLVPIPKPDEFPFSDSNSDSKKLGNLESESPDSLCRSDDCMSGWFIGGFDFFLKVCTSFWNR